MNGRRARGLQASMLMLVLIAAVCLGAGCSKDPAMASIETDAHGYLCQQCQVKLYTGKKVFLESKCPKCQQEGLVDVAGYWCEKDKHMTIRPKLHVSAGAVVCEKCGIGLRTAMISPREKDLLEWGAVKTASQK